MPAITPSNQWVPLDALRVAPLYPSLRITQDRAMPQTELDLSRLTLLLEATEELEVSNLVEISHWPLEWV